MTSEQIIGTILIGLPSLLMTAALGYYTVKKNRQTGSEANRNVAESNEIDRFKVFNEAYEQQRKHDAERVGTLEKRVDELLATVTAQGRQLASIKTAVQEWFARLWADWPHDRVSMPLPSTEELALLELQIPAKKKLPGK